MMWRPNEAIGKQDMREEKGVPLTEHNMEHQIIRG